MGAPLKPASAHDWRPWLALAAGLALYVVLQVVPPLRSASQNDFKHIWLGSMLLSQGQSPYDAELLKETAAIFRAEDARFETILPYVYLPFTGIVLRPLTWMSFDAAQRTWQLLNHVLFLAGIAVAARAAKWPWDWRWVCAAALAASFSFVLLRQTLAGQLNIVLLFACALLALGVVRGWHAGALGFIAAFAALFKLTPGVFLVWFLLRRRWREAAWMAAWCAVLLLGSIMLTGWRTHLDFLPLLHDMGYGRSTWATEGQTFWRDPANQSLNSFLHHILVPHGADRAWFNAGPGVANAVTWAASILLLAAFVRFTWKEGTDDRASFALAVMASLLLPSIMWDHYLVQAFVPMVLLLPMMGPGRGGLLRRGLIAACAILFAFPVFPTNGTVFFWMPEVLFGSLPVRGWAYPVMSLKLWPALALFGLCAWAADASCRPAANAVEEA